MLSNTTSRRFADAIFPHSIHCRLPPKTPKLNTTTSCLHPPCASNKLQNKQNRKQNYLASKTLPSHGRDGRRNPRGVFFFRFEPGVLPLHHQTAFDLNKQVCLSPLRSGWERLLKWVYIVELMYVCRNGRHLDD